MFHGKTEDTITALATPPGIGGIAVIRVSGKDALTISAEIFSKPDILSTSESHRAHVGEIIEADGEPIDEVVATIFKGPHSYTGEDVVEFSCHGGVFVARNVLKRIIEAGARMAEPGEFTKRAFLNGRIDLAQAEAVADIIHSESERALTASVRQLEGELSGRIVKMRDNIVQILSMLELELDFVEDGYVFAQTGEVEKLLTSSIDELEFFMGTYSTGRVYREGIKTVLAGAPNVGKSSLLNTLLGTNRAIVTEIPGTTRDTIEEGILLDGILYRLVDTAGVRDSADKVEQIGVERTKKEIFEADIILLVLDSTREISTEDSEMIEFCKHSSTKSNASTIYIFNKTDSASEKAVNSYKNQLVMGTERVAVSALTGEGIRELIEKLRNSAISEKSRNPHSSIVVTNARHFSALTRAVDALKKGLESARNRLSGEFVAVDIRIGLDCLGEITGSVTTEDILNSIFSRFCIGK